MVKLTQKVNKKSVIPGLISILMCLIIVLTSGVFLRSHAQDRFEYDPGQDGGTTTTTEELSNDAQKQSENTLKNVLDKIYSVFGDDQNRPPIYFVPRFAPTTPGVSNTNPNSPTRNPRDPALPSGTIGPNLNPTNNIRPSTQITRPITDGEYIMYRQRDYDDAMPDGCDIAYAGCGPTSVANVVANLKDSSATPPSIVNKHYGTIKFGQYRYASCEGSTYVGHEAALKAEGFITEIAYTGNPVKIDDIAEELIPFIRGGAWIVAGADFTGGGHFFVIIDIVPNGESYDIIGLETAYGSRDNIHFNYRYMYPYPYIKSAVAAKL